MKRLATVALVGALSLPAMFASQKGKSNPSQHNQQSTQQATASSTTTTTASNKKKVKRNRGHKHTAKSRPSAS